MSLGGLHFSEGKRRNSGSGGEGRWGDWEGSRGSGNWDVLNETRVNKQINQ